MGGQGNVGMAGGRGVNWPHGSIGRYGVSRKRRAGTGSRRVFFFLWGPHSSAFFLGGGGGGSLNSQETTRRSPPTKRASLKRPIFLCCHGVSFRFLCDCFPGTGLLFGERDFH